MGNLVPDILSAAAEIAKIAIDAAAEQTVDTCGNFMLQCYNACSVLSGTRSPTTRTANGLHTEPVSLVSSIAMHYCGYHGVLIES